MTDKRKAPCKGKYSTRAEFSKADKDMERVLCAKCGWWHYRVVGQDWMTGNEGEESRFSSLTPAARKKEIEKERAKRRAAREKRLTKAAQDRIRGRKSWKTREAKYLETARMIFTGEESDILVGIFIEALPTNAYNNLVQVWNHYINEKRGKVNIDRERKRVPKSRWNPLDNERVGPAKAGGRIPLQEALCWHMTDAEVDFWIHASNNHNGKPSITREMWAIHYEKEPLTYAYALMLYAHAQGWQDADDTLGTAMVHILEVAGRDLRKNVKRFAPDGTPLPDGKETDKRKLVKELKFTTRSRYDYWTWLRQCLHDSHKFGYIKEVTHENHFVRTKPGKETELDDYLDERKGRQSATLYNPDPTCIEQDWQDWFGSE